MNSFTGFGTEKVVRFKRYGMSIRYRPSNAISITFSPSLSQNFREDQWVTTRNYNNTVRYILGEVDQRTFNLTARINYNITPDFTIQYYGQPFISKGNYTDSKYVTDPLGKKFLDRVHRFSPSEIMLTEDLDLNQIDENNDGQEDDRLY